MGAHLLTLFQGDGNGGPTHTAGLVYGKGRCRPVKAVLMQLHFQRTGRARAGLWARLLKPDSASATSDAGNPGTWLPGAPKGRQDAAQQVQTWRQLPGTSPPSY